MKFSLINVEKQNNNTISGTWLQNHVGTLESATEKARKTEKANGNKIIVAVVEELSYSPDYSLKTNLERLDI